MTEKIGKRIRLAKVWMVHVGLTNPLAAMIKAEAKESGLTYTAIIRNRLLHSYKMDMQKAGVDYEQEVDF